MSKKQQFTNAVIYLLPTLISILLPIFSLPIILSNISSTEFGVYTIALVFGSVIIGFCQFSLLGVFERNYFSFKTDKEKAELLFTIITFIFFVMILVGLVIFLNKETFSLWILKSKDYGLLLFITFMGLIFQSIFNYYLSFLKNSGNAKLNVSLVMFTSIFCVSLNIYFVAIVKLGPIGLSYGLLISNTLVFIFATIYFIKDYGYKLKISILIYSIKLSLPLVPTGFLSISGKYFDKYIISAMSSMGGVGIYSISQKISDLSFLFMTAIQKVYGPIVYSKMFDNNLKNGDRELGVYLTPFAYLSIFATLIISLFSEEALIILAPPEYLSGLKIINVLCLSLSMSFFSKQPQLMYAGKTGVSSLLILISFILKIILVYILVNKLGIIGAAYGVFIVSIIYNFLLIWQGQKFYKINYEWTKLFIIYFTLIIMSSSILVIIEYNIDYVFRIMIKLLYVGIFLGLGNHLRIITKNNLFLIFNKQSR
jgi:O-antigen/teichoic acid export membrane protein